MSEWVSVNLNDFVRIKLNETGLRIHRSNYDELEGRIKSRGGKIYDYRAPKTDENGWHRQQLWSVMQDYGKHIYLGCEAPFETTIEVQPIAPKAKP